MITITETEFARLVDFVTDVTGDDLFAEAVADDLLSNHDFSDPEIGHSIEISETKTISGHPETFFVEPDEIRWDLIFHDLTDEDFDAMPGYREARDEARMRFTKTGRPDMQIAGVSTLEQLRDYLIANQDDDTIDWTELPTFGGEEPAHTTEVWSWDDTRVLVGSCAGDLEILSRDDENAWWN